MAGGRGVRMVGGVLSIERKAYHNLIQFRFIGNIIFYTVLHSVLLSVTLCFLWYFQ